MVDKTEARPDLPHVEPYIEIRFYIENMYADFMRIYEEIQKHVRFPEKLHAKGRLDGQFFMNSILVSYQNLSYRLSRLFRIVSGIETHSSELMDVSRALEKLDDQLNNNTDLERVFWLTRSYTEEKFFSVNDLNLVMEKLDAIKNRFINISNIPWLGISTLETISIVLLDIRKVTEEELIPILENGYYWLEWKVENEVDRQSLYSQALEESKKILGRELQEQEVNQVRAEIFGRSYDFWEVVVVAIDLLGNEEDFSKIPKEKIPNWWE
ncbi:MAG: hypothetical protein AAGG51_13500 [Cyanobacteria bacterium P01_G01_bin.54]